MARCNACKITIKDDTKICPLCGGSLEEDGLEAKESMYPTLVLKERIMVKVTRLVFLGMFLLEVFLIMINYALHTRPFWSVITGAAFLYVILVLYTTTIPHMSLKFRLLVLSLALILVSLTVDWVTGFKGWAISVALPIQVLFMDVVIFVLYLVQKKDFQQYLWIEFLNLFLCLIVLAAFLIGYRIFFGLMIAAFLVTGVELLVIMYRGGRRTPAELKRRFHA